MKRIAAEDLYPLELEILEFNLRMMRYTDEEKQFVYNNLFRDEKDLAYYPSKNLQKYFALYTD